MGRERFWACWNGDQTEDRQGSGLHENSVQDLEIDDNKLNGSLLGYCKSVYSVVIKPQEQEVHFFLPVIGPLITMEWHSGMEPKGFLS